MAQTLTGRLKPLHAGKIRHRVSIQSATTATDEYGGRTESWVTVTGGTLWAEIVPLRGGEFVEARQVQPEVTHVITLRYFSDITPKYSVLFGSRRFQILMVTNVEERRREMNLLCREMVL
jgi:SPP1 family predicted phage head-tail adaptor